MQIAGRKVLLTNVREAFISFQENDETSFSASDDFRAVCEDFETELRDRINSRGELGRFRANMKALAKMVKKGTFWAKWITSENEACRIDLVFTPKMVECVVYEDVVDIFE